MSRSVLPSLLLFFVVGCNAADVCENDRGRKTPHGQLSITTCVNSRGITTREWLSLDGKKILESTYLSEQEFSADRKKWIFHGEVNYKTGCASELYLVDIGRPSPKIIAFGVRKACNEFHWASWGAKRSVIAIKNNVRFVYENGKLIPPASGEKLWSSVEPPHAGPGLAVEEAVGFVEVLVLPK